MACSVLAGQWACAGRAVKLEEIWCEPVDIPAECIIHEMWLNLSILDSRRVFHPAPTFNGAVWETHLTSRFFGTV